MNKMIDLLTMALFIALTGSTDEEIIATVEFVVVEYPEVPETLGITWDEP